ncbi:Maf family protein [Reichenbachiella sp. MALMAid0571]|uniref:Maf family protein n=1 Tax=Reichenbachiella sp. MALMAid0571 TaxID=3143939 RepID=UPI0032DE6554
MNKLIVASNSPRRQELMAQAGFKFEVFTQDVDESVDESMPILDVAKYLAEKKNIEYRKLLDQEIVVTSDTVVIANDQILGKPKNADEARSMLQSMSDGSHLVITGVCISSDTKSISFDDTTKVYFKPITAQEIEYYIDNYKPYDKAGAYGIQEWIGMVAIDKIEGSFYNVMGLPIHKVYDCLKNKFGIFPKQ